MRKAPFIVGIATLLTVVAVPVIAQNASRGQPGTEDRTKVAAGTYTTDPNHSQIAWKVNHFGFNALHGLFSGATGTLTIDPSKPEAAVVDIQIPIAGLASGVPNFDKHAMTADLLDVAKFPTASFKSTSVTVDGDDAKIAGNLTLHGVTKPIVLDADFIGAGINPMSKKATIGFEAEAKIKRSDFGLSYGIPMVADEVELEITVAFEK